MTTRQANIDRNIKIMESNVALEVDNPERFEYLNSQVAKWKT